MATSENKQAWSKTAANNNSADSSINWTEGQDPATVNNSSRSMMAAEKKYLEDVDGGLAAGGTANALTVTTNQVLSSGHLAAGLQLKIRATLDNTSTTVTFAPDGLTAANIKRSDGSALAIGDIRLGMYLDLVYNAGSSEWRASNIMPTGPRGLIWGLTLANNSGDATNDIDIAVGEAVDGSGTSLMVLATAITKRLDAAWAVGTNQGGLDTGVIANTTYYLWLIARSDTGVVDVLFSTSATAPTMPTNYDRKRRIGAILRESAAIVAFSQLGDIFLRKVPVGDIAANAPGASAVTATLKVPSGIQVDALLSVTLRDDTAATAKGLLITSPDLTDTAAVAYSMATVSTNAVDAGVASVNSAEVQCRTSTAAAVRYRLSASDADTTVYITTNGWIDTRGRLV